jgi:RNA polymerase sigma-B factor
VSDTPRAGDEVDGTAADPDDPLEAFRRYRRTGDRRLRNELVEQHLELVEPYVRRYDRRGISPEDLRQVALLAMLKAVERFDPDYGVLFSTFAGRTIEGELMRLLRDKGWSVRPPRRHQEVYLAVRRAEEELTQKLGRSPTITELATATDESEDGVLAALEAGGARQAGSLDQPSGASQREPGALVAATEPGIAQLEVRLLVEQLMETLDEREQQVIRMRFFDEMGQPEIADQLGLSQSYVSRLIRRTLEAMRETLAAVEPPPA